MDNEPAEDKRRGADPVKLMGCAVFLGELCMTVGVVAIVVVIYLHIKHYI